MGNVRRRNGRRNRRLNETVGELVKPPSFHDGYREFKSRQSLQTETNILIANIIVIINTFKDICNIFKCVYRRLVKLRYFLKRFRCETINTDKIVTK